MQKLKHGNLEQREINLLNRVIARNGRSPRAQEGFGLAYVVGKKNVTALVHDRATGEVWTGVARCSRKDPFVESAGKDLAFVRAINEMAPKGRPPIHPMLKKSFRKRLHHSGGLISRDKSLHITVGNTAGEMLIMDDPQTRNAKLKHSLSELIRLAPTEKMRQTARALEQVIRRGIASEPKATV